MQAYMITNTQNGKSYIGITTRTVSRRWYEHCFVKNSCGQLLNKAINKYGKDSFIIETIASAKTLKDLKEIEKQLIDQNQTKVPHGYNLTNGGDGLFGYKFTEEQKKRNGDAKRGIKASEETKKKMQQSHLGEKNHFYGKKHTEETKRKNAEAHIGNQAMFGKTHSQETRNKISKALTGQGRPHTEEAKKKISLAHMGKKQGSPSPETRLKLSLATKKVWEQRKLKQIEQRI
jgi:hypothetical protein